jgi:hypothetical protein
MKTLIISAALIRGAQACQATKKDARYYLHGFLLVSSGDIVSTNGHILFKGIVGAGDKPDVDTIIEISGKIPANAETVTFTFSDPERGICTTNNGKAFPFQVIDAKYPDCNRVIPKRYRTEHSDGFSVQAQYLAAVMSVFGKNASVNVYPATHNDSVRVEYACGTDSTHALKSALMVIMPVRSGGDFRVLGAPVPVDTAAA